MTGRSRHLVGRDARMAELANQGKTTREIADDLKVDIQLVGIWARLNGVKLHRRFETATTAELQARTEKMTGMYRQGVTLEKIGQQFNVTRERVRQILSKNGISATDGGGAKNASAKRAVIGRNRDAHYMVKYGLPRVVVQQLQKDRVTYAFCAQKASAGRRAIGWELHFSEWFTVWQASGKLHLRGRGIGKYVMSRIKDDGPYALGNVHIQLATENSTEAVNKWKGKTKDNRGVYCLYPGRDLAWMAKVGKVSLGFFKTEFEAVEARNKFIAQNPDAIVVGKGYAHIKGQQGRQDRYQVMVGKKYVGSYLTPEEARAAKAAYIAATSNPEGRPLLDFAPDRPAAQEGV